MRSREPDILPEPSEGNVVTAQSFLRIIPHFQILDKPGNPF